VNPHPLNFVLISVRIETLIMSFVKGVLGCVVVVVRGIKLPLLEVTFKLFNYRNKLREDRVRSLDDLGLNSERLLYIVCKLVVGRICWLLLVILY